MLIGEWWTRSKEVTLSDLAGEARYALMGALFRFVNDIPDRPDPDAPGASARPGGDT